MSNDRHPAFAVAALTLLLGLTGCVPGAPGQESSSATTGTGIDATAEPVDPLTTVTAIVARSEAIELHDASGSIVDRFEYTDSPAEALTALTVVFGRAPEDTFREAASLHTPPRIEHAWEAFTLDERLYSDDIREKQEASGLTMPDFLVFFTAAEAGGIDLATASGVAPGDDIEALRALGVPIDESCVGPAVDPVDARNVEYPQMRVGVALRIRPLDAATETPAPVDQIVEVVAPDLIGGGCI